MLAGIPESMLKKKTSSVAYHFVCEGVTTSDEWKTTYINTKDNPSNIMTKNLPAGMNQYWKVRMVLYDIYPEDKY